MAIDSAAKRASCIGLALIFLRTGVGPDAGNLSAPQRLHVDGLYSGIAANPPIPDVAYGMAALYASLGTPTLAYAQISAPTIAFAEVEE